MTIGHVSWPNHWRTVPLWSLFHRVKDVGHPDEEMLSVYRDYGVIRKTSRTDNANKTAENRNIYQLVDVGWLIVNRMKAWQGSLGISTERGIVSGHYLCFRPRHDEDARFLDYLLRSAPYRDELCGLSRGVRPNQIEIDNDWLRVLQVRLPGVQVQRAIADYLDAETSRIDALIEKKRRMAGLLQERLSILITRTIAGGLSPTSPVKDSGSTWLPSVPAHWDVVRLRHIAKTFIGLTYSPQDVVADDAGGALVLRAGNVKDGEIALDDNVYVRTRVPVSIQATGGEILICARSGSAQLVGKSAVIPAALAGATWGAFMVAVRSAYNDFLAWVLRSSIFVQQVGLFTTSTINQLTSATLHDMPIPLPPVTERDAIVRHLDEQANSADRLVTALRNQVTLLQERRQALITAAVTGQLVIPETAA